MATKAIPVTAAQVSGTSHTDFPVYIKPSAMSGWTTLTTAEAESIRFYSDSGLTTELAREVVSADEIHVKVGTLDDSTTIYADYDGVRADYGSTDTYGRNNVWSDYEAVYHLGELYNGTAGEVVDATGSGNDGVAAGNPAQDATSPLGNGQSFDGSGDYIEVADSSGLDISGQYTIQAWASAPPDSSTWYPILTKGSFNNGGTFDTNYELWVPRSADGSFGSELFTRYTDSSNNAYIASGGTAMNIGWFLGHARFDGSTLKSYINASEVASSNTTANPDPNDQPLVVSARYDGRDPGIDNINNGDVDEIRIRKSALSADWITTEYNNQNAPGTFWGTVTDAGGGGGGATTAAARRAFFFGI